jgi:hypothetical protein
LMLMFASIIWFGLLLILCMYICVVTVELYRKYKSVPDIKSIQKNRTSCLGFFCYEWMWSWYLWGIKNLTNFLIGKRIFYLYIYLRIHLVLSVSLFLFMKDSPLFPHSATFYIPLYSTLPDSAFFI